MKTIISQDINFLFPFAEYLRACSEDEGARGTPNEALAKWGGFGGIPL
jgi:hypothetical protein